jgi:hypothetical protein
MESRGSLGAGLVICAFGRQRAQTYAWFTIVS